MADQAHTWHRGRSKQDGTPFFLIPSSDKPDKVAHRANVHGCTCTGFKNRGVCAHNEACQILRQRADAAITANVQAADRERTRRTYADLFGDDEPQARVTITRPCASGGCPVAAGANSALCPAHTRQQRAAVAA